MHRSHAADHSQTHSHHYTHLAIMAALSFVAMYILMYSMVDRFSSVYNNINQVYMAALMAAPMVIIELIVMRSMYANRSLNIAIIGGSILLALLCWFAIRQQWAVGDSQFLRSMIPHHSGAILMCREADLQQQEIRTLCQQIIKSQQEEINLMARLLAKS